MHTEGYFQPCPLGGFESPLEYETNKTLFTAETKTIEHVLWVHELGY
jgi:hypothetical protein